MTHKINFNAEVGIIQIRPEEVITFNEVKKIISEATVLAKEHQCYLWLIDYSHVRPHFSTIEIYELPKLFVEAAKLLNIHIFQIKRAIVTLEAHADYEFAKTVSANRGQSLELFYDLEEAINWLTHKKSE